MIRRLALFVFMLAPAAAVAQTGTAPTILRIPAGVRSMVFSDAYVEGVGGEEVFLNPARLSSGPGSIVSGGWYGSNAKMGSVATTLAVAGNFTAGFGARYLDYQAPNGLPGDPADLSLPGTIQTTSLAATFALQHSILGLQMGGSVTYVAVHRPDGRNAVATYSAGITQNIGSFNFSLVAQDLGQQLVVNNVLRDVPERLTLGATSQSIPVGAFIDITPYAAVTANRAHDIRPSGGINFTYTPVQGFEFAARIGARWVDSTTTHDQSPLSFGLGFTLDQLTIDYAFQPYTGGAPAAHRFGLRAR